MDRLTVFQIQKLKKRLEELKKGIKKMERKRSDLIFQKQLIMLKLRGNGIDISSML